MHQRSIRSNAALYAVASVGLLLFACTGTEDSTQTFHMRLGQDPCLPGVGDAIALIEELEAGFSVAHQCSIVFPQKLLPQQPRPGIEIQFDPAGIEVGSELEFGAGRTGGDVQLAYYPNWGQKYDQGLTLVFCPSEAGWGRIRLDELDPQLGGRVRGVLLEAVLYGHYEDMDGLPVELEEPLELHLWNFPFDTTFRESSW
jgi:hypothetical protein